MENVVHFGAQSSSMEMTTNEREIIKEIHKLDKNFDVRITNLETKIDDNINGRFKDLERRYSEHAEKLNKHDEDISDLKSQPHRAKSKWFDEVAKYIVIALLSYMLFKSGIK